MPNNKKILIIQLRPEDATANSEFAAILRAAGLKPGEVERLRAEQSDLPRPKDLAKYSAVIVGGSPFDISTPDAKKSAAQKRVESQFNDLFKEILERDFPFLGACSGAGLLGNYRGAKISGKYAEPVGGVDIALTKEGKRDKLLAGFPGAFRALAGHKEACETAPEGAVLLAKSASCPVQMFRLGENVYATQFHPEADAAEFELRIKTYKHHGYFPPQEADKLIAKVRRESTPWAQKVLFRFASFYGKVS